MAQSVRVSELMYRLRRGPVHKAVMIRRVAHTGEDRAAMFLVCLAEDKIQIRDV